MAQIPRLPVHAGRPSTDSDSERRGPKGQDGPGRVRYTRARLRRKRGPGRVHAEKGLEDDRRVRLILIVYRIGSSASILEFDVSATGARFGLAFALTACLCS